MKANHITIALLFFVSLSGCAGESQQGVDSSDPADTTGSYSDGRFFALTGCQGVELAHEWIGPPGPHGPPPPPEGWQDAYAQHQFSWSLEILECQRLGWGPLEQGPVSLAIEVHNAYDAPEECLIGLDETVFTRYIHRMYFGQDDAFQYSQEWGMPAEASNFSQNAGVLNSVIFRIATDGSQESKITMHKMSAFHGNAAPISVAFFWFQEELVHRLTLHRESRTSLGDAAILEMSSPSIMADFPGSVVANASLLTELHWTGELVTFNDATCQEPVRT